VKRKDPGFAGIFQDSREGGRPEPFSWGAVTLASDDSVVGPHVELRLRSDSRDAARIRLAAQIELRRFLASPGRLLCYDVASSSRPPFFTLFTSGDAGCAMSRSSGAGSSTHLSAYRENQQFATHRSISPFDRTKVSLMHIRAD
jgi:hypothetical protein